jgi:hypothetical protein
MPSSAQLSHDPHDPCCTFFMCIQVGEWLKIFMETQESPGLTWIHLLYKWATVPTYPSNCSSVFSGHQTSCPGHISPCPRERCSRPNLSNLAWRTYNRNSTLLWQIWWLHYSIWWMFLDVGKRGMHAMSSFELCASCHTLQSAFRVLCKSCNVQGFNSQKLLFSTGFN